MNDKKHKVIVVGLPKTGTSTLTIMLRMLKYKVTGPDGDYNVGNYQLLDSKFKTFDAFQDFPWCFEWKRYLNHSNVKFIILKRDKKSWFKSFFESYGRKQERYMSYPFMRIKKDIKNKNQFLNYFDEYYAEAEATAKLNPNQFLSVCIESFNWTDLCAFLNEPIPKTIFGKPVKKPHVNKKNYKTKFTLQNKLKVILRRVLLPVIGANKWHEIVSVLRKNKMYN